MSIPVPLDDLEMAIRDRDPVGYILTVSEAGTPHVVQAEISRSVHGLIAIVGARPASIATRQPHVAVLYPSRYPADYSLIVDALATVATGGVSPRLLLTPTRAVLHRSVPTTSPCRTDCVPVFLDASAPKSDR